MKGKKQTDNYYNVLNAFIDKKDSYYSIHQIGKMYQVSSGGSSMSPLDIAVLVDGGFFHL